MNTQHWRVRKAKSNILKLLYTIKRNIQKES